MNDSQTILNIIVENISKKGLKEKQCLTKCGINASFLSEWRSGKIKKPAYDKILKLSAFLDIDLNFLFFGYKKANLAPELTKIELECLDKFNVLTEMDKGRILDRMQTMYEAYDLKDKGK